jgi:hypothetical protein
MPIHLSIKVRNTTVVKTAGTIANNYAKHRKVNRVAHVWFFVASAWL